jgi:small subunit ribosomal protein S1
MVKQMQPQNVRKSSSLDEGWWTALLTEEQIQASNDRLPASNPSTTNPPSFSKPSNNQPQTQINWEHAGHIFTADEIVTLRVSGYNQGGLLVEGDGLQGFVPASHLINPCSEPSQAERQRQLGSYVGHTLSLKAIECAPGEGRIIFSERAALAQPGRRPQLLRSLHPGDCVRGIITNVTDFGAFVDLGGVEGLIHVSEISWGRVRHPADVLRLGDHVEVCVLNVDAGRGRVALSLKRLCSNPWDNAAERYHPGQVVEAVITAIVPFGAFARLEEGLDGLIHISEIKKAGQATRPMELLHEGQRVRACVLHVNPTKQRLGLSLEIPEAP